MDRYENDIMREIMDYEYEGESPHYTGLGLRGMHGGMNYDNIEGFGIDDDISLDLLATLNMDIDDNTHDDLYDYIDDINYEEPDDVFLTRKIHIDNQIVEEEIHPLDRDHNRDSSVLDIYSDKNHLEQLEMDNRPYPIGRYEEEAPEGELRVQQREYGRVSGLVDILGDVDDSEDHYQPDIISASFEGATFDDVHFDDPRENDLGLLHQDQEFDVRESTHLQRVYVTNFLEDLIIPLMHGMEIFHDHEQANNRDNARDITGALYNILQATINNTEESQTSAMNSIKFQYDLFMRHPVWNTLTSMNKYLISPMFNAASSVLFGRNTKKSIDEKILKAIEKQTEFAMTGEVQGRGFMDKLLDRGVVGTMGSLVAGVVLDSVGISKSEAQRREDARSRGDKVGFSIGGWLTDQYGKGDITKRGRGGRGEIEEGTYKSNTEKVVEWLPKAIEKKLTRQESSENVSNASMDSIESLLQYDNPDQQQTDDLSIMQVGMIRSMLVGEANISLTSDILRDISVDFSEILNEFKIGLVNSTVGDTLSFETITSSQISSEGDVVNVDSLLEQISNVMNNSKVLESSYADNMDTGNIVYDSYYKQPSDDPIGSYIDEGSVLSTGNEYEQNSTNSLIYGGSGLGSDSGNDEENVIDDSDLGEMFNRITNDDGISVDFPELMFDLDKQRDDQSIINRKQSEVWDDEELNRMSVEGVLRDIRKYGKTSASEITKVRRQGFWRMLMGIGGSLLSGVASVVSGVLSIGGAIVAAIGGLAAAMGGRKLLERVGMGGGGGRSKAPRTPTGGTTAGGKYTGGKMSTGAKVGGALALAGAAHEGWNIWNDEEATTGEKLRDTTGTAGGLVGGLAGAKAGATLGAVVGSFVPVVGTAIGGIVGGIGGGLAGSMAGGAIGDKLGSVFTLGRTKDEDEQYHLDKAEQPSLMDTVKEKTTELGSKISSSLFGEANEDVAGKTTPKDNYVETRKDYETLTDSLSSIQTLNQQSFQEQLPNERFYERTGTQLFEASPETIGVQESSISDKYSSIATIEHIPVEVSEGVKERPTFDNVIQSMIDTSGESPISNKRTEDNISEGISEFNTSADKLNVIASASEDYVVGVRSLIDPSTTESDDRESEKTGTKSMLQSVIQSMIDESGDNSVTSTPISTSEAKSKNITGSNTKIESSRYEVVNLDKIGNSIVGSISDIGKTITESLKVFTGRDDYDESDNITAIQTTKQTMELQTMISDNTLNISEGNEQGNKYLKSIEKSLRDMLMIQKKAGEDAPSDNSGIMNTMRDYISRK